MIIVIKRGSSLVVMYKNSGTSSFREKSKLHGQSRAIASGGGGGGGGGQGGSCLPSGPVEQDTSSVWMDLFSLDSVILIIVTCNCLPFSYSRSIFRRHVSCMTSAENRRFGASKIENFLGEDTPRLPYKALALGTRDNVPAPLQKT